MRKALGAALVLCAGTVAAAQWQAAATAPVIRSRAAGAIIGGAFYLIGGETTGGARDVSCFKLDIASNTWSPIANLPNIGIGNGGVSNVDAAAIGTDIYLPGGWSGAQPHNRLVRYDSTTDTWTEVTSDPLPSNLYAACVTAHAGKLYVFGGSTASGVLAVSGYIYDPAAPAGTRWRTVPGAPTGRQYPSGVALNGKIYVVGGIGAVTTSEYATTDVYDVATNTWSTIPAMSAPRGGPAAFARGSDLYVVGGGWTTYRTTGELFSGGAWAASDACNVGVRTIAHDGNNQYLVKSTGWSGAYRGETEVFTLSTCPCACNYDTSTGTNVCDIFDFLSFQNAYDAGDPCACDQDTSTGPNTCDIFDFLEFQNRYDAGCP